MGLTRNIGIVALMGILIIAGYYTFVLFMTQVISNLTSLSLALVAIIAGIATFFNPCSFPTIPAYLTSFYSAGKQTKDSKLNTILFYGLIASLGIITFNIIFGALIGLLGEGFGKSFALATEQPNVYVLIFRGLIGVLLVSLGLMALLGYGFHSGIFAKISKAFYSLQSKNPVKSLYLYGFGYNAIGIGCAGPIMAGLSVFALGYGGIFPAITAFLIFSITMSLLMVVLSLLAGTAKTGTIRKLSMSTVTIKKFSSVVIVLVGLYLILSSIYVRGFVSLLFPG